MALTEQQVALEKARKKYGPKAYTEWHINYKLVGFKRRWETIFCIGHTWDEAFEGLERKVGR